MPKIEDKRVKRTKRDIKTAFLYLLKQKDDLKKVSVIDIAAKAEYNRATFYVHYPDKLALVQEIIEESINGFKEAFKEPYEATEEINLREFSSKTIKIFQYLAEDQERFKLLFTHSAFVGFKALFVDAIHSMFYEDLMLINRQSTGIIPDIYIQSQSYSLLGVIIYWVDSNFQYSAEVMADQVLKMGINKVTTFKVRKTH